MFYSFRTFEFMFMSKTDLLFFFLVPSMPGFGTKNMLNDVFSIIWSHLWLFGSISFLIIWLNLVMKFSDHGICFVGIYLTAYSIYFMIVDYVGILFFFSPRRFLSVNFSIIKSALLKYNSHTTNAPRLTGPVNELWPTQIPTIEMKWSEVKLLSHVWLFATPWTVAHQAPLSMGFSKQEYWSGLPFPPPIPTIKTGNIFITKETGKSL